MTAPAPPQGTPPPTPPAGLRELGWRAVGGLMFVLGAVGLVLPVWPTTIFWILAALAFARSWPRMRDRLYAWPRVGTTIQTFVEQGVMSRRSKRHAILGMLFGLALALVIRPTLIVAVSTGGLVLLGILYVATRPEPL